ncbi:MAG: hypothetical protein QW727_01860 [Candidatus Pacearchaeota archaeon]
MPYIKYEDFSKLDIRTATIIKVEDIDGADKLYKLHIDLGKEIGKKIICAGIKEFYSKKELDGKTIIVIVNLEPRKLKGILSEGMLLAADKNGKPILLTTDSKCESGKKIH